MQHYRRPCATKTATNRRNSEMTNVALTVSALLFALDACGNGTAPLSHVRGASDFARVSGETVSSDLTTMARHGRRPGPSGKSRLAGVRKGSNLLFVTDYPSNAVMVYNYPPQGSEYLPAYTLYNINGPQGACSDNTGKNVFIVSSKSSQILEFRYGAKKPRLVISDANQVPVGCAVDVHGNLAVTNIRSLSNGNGSISVYTAPLSPSSVPTIYSDPTMYRFYFLTYDPQGNIFADGFTTQKFFGLTKLTGDGTFTDITTSNTILFPGGVSYDQERNYVTVGDQLASKVYGYSVSGAYAKRKQTTKLRRGFDVVQYYLKSGSRGIIAPDANSYPPATYSYRYPRGGLPIPSKTLVGGPLVMPVGAAVANP